MKSKRKRRWREKRFEPFITSVHKEGRVHDFLKGWGTICKDGSTLWDHYRPPSKRELERYRKRYARNKGNPPTILFPMINATMPHLSIKDIMRVQPMM